MDTNQQPIEGATIVMQLSDSTYLGAAISAADGTFVLEPEPESYQLDKNGKFSLAGARDVTVIKYTDRL